MFKASIADYEYYVNFQKVHRNIDGVRVELNILNSLIGSHDIEGEFDRLIFRYPETLKCIPLLLAVRANEIHAIDGDGEFRYSFSRMNYSTDQYKLFMRKTGLFDLMEKRIISSLVDYATGVETGLDSNGRKNRGGILMERLVEAHMVKTGLRLSDTYYRELSTSVIKEKWGIDLSGVSIGGPERRRAEKRFDFVVKTASMVYGVETNFYTGGGSKLNETARSYKLLAQESAVVPGFKFVWFTDGQGWHSARHNLKETFDAMEHLYNIEDIKNGVMTRIFV